MKGKVGDVIEGGEEYNVIRTIQRRLARHLWLLYLYVPDSGRKYWYTYTTKEISGLVNQYGVKEKRG